jgi:hypothetical protein
MWEIKFKMRLPTMICFAITWMAILMLVGMTADTRKELIKVEVEKVIDVKIDSAFVFNYGLFLSQHQQSSMFKANMQFNNYLWQKRGRGLTWFDRNQLDEYNIYWERKND